MQELNQRTRFEQLVMPHLEALTEPGMENDLRAVAKWIESDSQADGSRMAVVGYCMGGRAAFLANSILPLRCAVSYYGGRIAPVSWLASEDGRHPK